MFSFSPSSGIVSLQAAPGPVYPPRRVNSEATTAAPTAVVTTAVPIVEEESAVELTIRQEDQDEDRVEVGKAAPYEIKCREEFKCKVRGQEIRSQLEGFVRLVGSGVSPEQRELEGGVDESLNVDVQMPPTELSVNPTLKHKRERDKNVLRVSFDHRAATGVLPAALIKYKVDGFHVPLCVRCKTQVKGNDSFLLLQVDVALNLQVYAAKRLCVSEVKVSLKGLSSQVLDARGKQSNGIAFSFNPETSVASWLVTGRGDSAPVQTFVCRIELYNTTPPSSSSVVSLPTVVLLKFPSHLVGQSAFTTDSPLSTVSTSSTLEYTFL